MNESYYSDMIKKDSDGVITENCHIYLKSEISVRYDSDNDTSVPTEEPNFSIKNSVKYHEDSDNSPETKKYFTNLIK